MARCGHPDRVSRPADHSVVDRLGQCGAQHHPLALGNIAGRRRTAAGGAAADGVYRFCIGLSVRLWPRDPLPHPARGGHGRLQPVWPHARNLCLCAFGHPSRRVHPAHYRVARAGQRGQGVYRFPGRRDAHPHQHLRRCAPIRSRTDRNGPLGGGGTVSDLHPHRAARRRALCHRRPSARCYNRAYQHSGCRTLYRRARTGWPPGHLRQHVQGWRNISSSSFRWQSSESS